MTSQHELVVAALRALGNQRLVLAIHDVSFPSMPDEDLGHGSPYCRGGHAFVSFARELGFDGLQLGPQGQTSLVNPSPYDGSVFSKSHLAIGLGDLAGGRFGKLLPARTLELAARDKPASDSRAHYTYAYEAQAGALDAAHASLQGAVQRNEPEALALRARIDAFAGATAWLRHDARFEAFSALHGTDAFSEWPAADRAPSAARIADVEREQSLTVDRYVFRQYLLDAQHRAFREHLATLGVRLYGDMQIGLSLRDRWSRGHLFLDRYRMGAPPSRTNPAGQPWGYPVLDPRQYQRRFARDGGGADEAGSDDAQGPIAFVRARVEKLFAELDGVRIDHPHGLVCPWVYDATLPDPMHAVVHGARLFETPASPAHPALVAFAIARPEQIDPSVPDYDDHHVRGLDAEQIDAYERFFELVMQSARAAGRTVDDVLCEVLSTCPTPLACVMQRYGLGRFRVTQKASLVDVEDGYRGENADPRDWIMIGNHDTDPLLAVIERWQKRGTVGARAAYLATRLEPEASRREAFAASLVAEPRRLVSAMFAELFVGPAANVLVFWADLFGERDTYNTPGLVSERNWSMRLPPAYRELYAERRARGEAMDVPAALAMAMRARGADFVRANADLIGALEALT